MEGSKVGPGNGKRSREALTASAKRKDGSKSHARRLLGQLLEESRKACSDPLRIAREQHERLHRVGGGGYQVAHDLVDIILDHDVSLDGLSHVGQTALLLLLRLEQHLFFPEEWSKAVAFLSSESREQWKNEFKELCLSSPSPGREIKPLPTPKWILDLAPEPAITRVTTRPKEPPGQEIVQGEGEQQQQRPQQGVPDEDHEAAPRSKARQHDDDDTKGRLVQFLSSLADGMQMESSTVLQQLKALLLDVFNCEDEEGVLALSLEIHDDVLSQLLSIALDGDPSLADVTLYFRFLLVARTLRLEKSPSQTFTNAMKSAAAAHPRTFSEIVLKRTLKSASLSPAQVELLRKVLCIEQLKRFYPSLLDALVLLEAWNESHLVIMQTLIQSCKAIPSKTVASLSSQMRERRESFGSSLHFAKVIHILVKKFPKEALEQREHFLEALDYNKTFFSKSTCAKLVSLREK